MGILDLFIKRKKETVSPPRLEMTVYRVPQKERVSPPPEKERVCPYCQKAFEKKPTRKIKCTHCERFIYVRHGELITEEQKVKHDDLELFQFTEEEYTKKQSQLFKKFRSMPSHSDIIWGIANSKIPVLFSQRAYYDLRDLYLAMAKHMHSRGKDFIDLFNASRKYELLALREGGLHNITIEICGAASPSCQIYADKTMPIDEAIALMPVPNANCLNKSRKDFYICMYM